MGQQREQQREQQRGQQKGQQNGQQRGGSRGSSSTRTSFDADQERKCGTLTDDASAARLLTMHGGAVCGHPSPAAAIASPVSQPTSAPLPSATEGVLHPPGTPQRPFTSHVGTQTPSSPAPPSAAARNQPCGGGSVAASAARSS
eukprot:317716-Chlamydomonas_euryale.AAC.1